MLSFLIKIDSIISIWTCLLQLLQTAQPNSNTSPALGTQLAALAALLQTASQPNVLSLLGNGMFFSTDWILKNLSVIKVTK